MTRYILHIGLHKTGTSALQSFFAANRLGLLEAGIDFPLLGRSPIDSQAHRYIASWYRRQDTEYPAGFGEVVKQGFSDAPACVLSCEDFYFFKRGYQVDGLAKVIGSGALVICYLRDPVSHVLSMYKERIKGNLTHSFSQVVEAYRAELEDEASSYSYYSFARNLAQWESRFKLIAAPYRRDGLVADFFERSGLRFPAGYKFEEVRSNASASNASAIVQLAINRSLADGALTQRAWYLLSKRVRLGEENGKVADVEPFARPASVDMTGFIAAFRRVNGPYANYADSSASELLFWDTEHLDHQALTRAALDFYYQ